MLAEIFGRAAQFVLGGIGTVRSLCLASRPVYRDGTFSYAISEAFQSKPVLTPLLLIFVLGTWHEVQMASSALLQRSHDLFALGGPHG